jgi:hypothetical protein
MTLSDHLRLIWPNRPFVMRVDIVTFDDGLPMPTQEELDASREEAQELWNAEKTKSIIVSMRSFREACGRDLVIKINAFVASIPDAYERFSVQNDLEYALTVARDHPKVAQVAAAIGKTESEIDEVFALAQQLDAA